VNYAGKVGEAQNVVDEIGKADGEALAIKADVSNSQEVRQLFDKTIEAFGDVDVLVNNAGIMTLSNIAATDDATFDRQIAVNLKGTFNGLREAAKRLRNYGRIINFSSSVIGLRLETYGVYARRNRQSKR
jgi:3-oxoacyl-[acyl-carrier protein] reductase